MKYYFNVKEIFTKTIAVEADDILQAEARLRSAYNRDEFVIDHSIADSMEIISIAEEELFTEEKFEILNCNDVVYDDEMEAYVCPVCDNYVADIRQIKDIEYPLPNYCCDCGAKLHY